MQSRFIIPLALQSVNRKKNTFVSQENKIIPKVFEEERNLIEKTVPLVKEEKLKLDVVIENSDNKEPESIIEVKEANNELPVTSSKTSLGQFDKKIWVIGGSAALVLALIGAVIYISSNKDSFSSFTSSSNYRTVNPPRNGQTGRVTSSDGIYMRQSTSKDSKKLGYIPTNATVTVIDDNGPDEVLYNIKSKWIKIEYKGARAWVFGGFVSN